MQWCRAYERAVEPVIIFRWVASPQFGNKVRTRQVVSLVSVVMLIAPPVLGADGYPYSSAPNDGFEVREGGYADRWTRNSQPWSRERFEPSRPAAQSRSGYDEAPYAAPGNTDGSRYGARSNGWSSSPEQPRPPAYASPSYRERFAEERRDSRWDREPAFQGQSDEYGYGPSALPAYPQVDDWRDDAAAGQSPPWSGGEDWQQQRYPTRPPSGEKRNMRDTEVSRGMQDERSRDPWDASYTPTWEGENSSSYYDPEPFDPWMDTEVEQNGWQQQPEERPWARRRPPPTEDARAAPGESRRWDGNAPPDQTYRFGAGFGPYGESWYYPSFYGGYLPPLGAPGVAGLSGISAWERMLWGGGLPGPFWWY